ncbi:L,D-transpeptidase [Streptacidiphilus carbonis]|uniref:L,D-transpeptidase n=1 Tax=Streptacidiphilus carbonis TaxID=105422 RepID=UPI0005AB14EC|nr:L,D-transpeptidase [Streptacidiphilus carbonis]
MNAQVNTARRTYRWGNGLVGAGAAAVCALALAGCSAGGAGSDAAAGVGAAPRAGASNGAVADPSAAPGTPSAPATASAAPSASPSPSGPTVPEPAVLATAQVNIAEGQTVGVGMPISVTFQQPVPASQRAAVEQWLTVRTGGQAGAWSWIKDRDLPDGERVDYRPQGYWKPGTRVTLQLGSHTVRHFGVGRSLKAVVDVRTHRMTVVDNGRTTSIPITAGQPGLDTWNGTMVVMDKAQKVLMDSRTVGLGDAYLGYYYWAVHITTSGTYVHQNPRADTYGGRENVTHGCVGLADDGTAKAFYNEVIPGDVVEVVHSKDTVEAGNGYGDWNLSWTQWLAGSALKGATGA